ncbi:hypothetical protein BJY52DRAFT_833280 [Lactarius psammicola]|nr:hypothetical protein BJY52DRAFT_833280 [Lactarius psammicola]
MALVYVVIDGLPIWVHSRPFLSFIPFFLSRCVPNRPQHCTLLLLLRPETQSHGVKPWAMSSPLYRYSANGPDPNLNTTMGMILIGLVVDTMLYGIMFFQTYLYFTSGARDRTSLRALVAVLWYA